MTADEETIPGELNAIKERLSAGDVRMGRMELRLDENTKVTRDNAETTQEIKDLIVAAKLGFKVLGGLGIAFKWLAMFATAVAALWSAYLVFRNGGSK